MPVNRFREAIKEPGNLVGIITSMALSVAVSAVVSNPLPLLAGPVLEILYLAVVPNSAWYRARLSAREKAKEEGRRQAFKTKILSTLRADMQQRYARLESARAQIAEQMQPDEKWFSDVTPRLDSLLEKFLVFAGKESTFLQYLRGLRNEIHDEDLPASPAPPPDAAPQPSQLDPTQRWGQQTVGLVQAAYARELEELNRELAGAKDEAAQVVLKKRAEILAKRADYLAQIGKILLNLGYQLQLLEDTFGLINDQLRARAPEQIVADIDNVIFQTDSMVKVLDELAPYEQMVSGLELSPTLARWNT